MNHFVVELKWTEKTAHNLSIKGRYFTPPINGDPDYEFRTSFDREGRINGVWLKERFQLLRSGPEDCVVNNTLVLIHITNIKPDEVIDRALH